MTAEKIARALGGRKVRQGWTVRCPAHNDRRPSLSVRDGADGKVLVHCHAGCDQSEVITALCDRGLWVPIGLRKTPRRPRRSISNYPSDEVDIKPNQAALAIWKSTIPAAGSLVEAFMSTRSLKLPLPETLRFHRDLKHPSGGKGQQKVTVEHVHVHAGGQAIVGNVERPGGGDTTKMEEQPHAKQIVHASEPAMPCPDKAREAVPLARDGERAMPDARGNVARSTRRQR